MIQKERIVKEFQELTAIDSPSFSERAFADVLRVKLEALGFRVSEDNAGDVCHGNAGNLFGTLQGSLPGEPLLFSAHMDTVDPALGKQAVIDENGRITSAGDTVLGSDDVAGIVAILEGVRHLQEEGIPHRNIEVLFTIGEEKYGGGAEAFDYTKLQAKEAYILDLDGAPGTASTKEPTLTSFKITVHGKAAHAGFEPEKGINAIAECAKCIALIKQGWTNPETTLNIGTIAGGKANNIVSEECVITGETRAFLNERTEEALAYVKNIFAEHLEGATFEMETTSHLISYDVPHDHPVVTRFIAACHACGLAGDLTTTFGGSDNNYYMRKGITGIVLSCGMHQVHSTAAYTTADELVDGATLVASLLQQP